MSADARVQFIIDAEDRMDAIWANVERRVDQVRSGAKSSNEEQVKDEQQLILTEEERAATVQTVIDKMQALALTTDLTSSRQVAFAQEAIASNLEYLEEIGAETAALEELDIIQSRLKNDVLLTAQAQNEASAEAVAGYEAQSESMLNVDAGMQRAGRAAIGLTFAAEGLGRGGRFAAIQMGILAQSIATLAEGTVIAEAATGIGLIVTVLGGLWILFDMVTGKEDKADAKLLEYKNHLKDLASEEGIAGTRQELEKWDAQLDADQKAEQDAIDKLDLFERAIRHVELAWDDLFGAGHAKNFFRDLFGGDDETRRITDDQNHIAAIQKQLTEETRAEEKKARDKAAADKKAQLEYERGQRKEITDMEAKQQEQLSQLTLVNVESDRLSYERKYSQEQALFVLQYTKAVEAENDKFEKQQKAHGVTQQEVADHQRILLLLGEEAETQESIAKNQERGRDVQLRQKGNQNDPALEIKTRLDMIAQERAANIAATNDVAAADKVAHEAKVALLQSYISKSESALDHLEKATINSKNKELKAVGEAAKTLRQLQIGADAAHALVLSAKYAAQSIAAFAVGDVAGGAGLALAAVDMAAAAATGFAEAGVGGGSSGGGGGGGAGSAASQTFTPTSAGRGNTVINLMTRDPYSGDAIQNVAYQLNQSQVLDTPINVPPTNGVVPVPGR